MECRSEGIDMSTAKTVDLVVAAREAGYAVPAVNIVDDLSLRAVVAAAEEAQSPVIIQTSVKTVKSVGAPLLSTIFSFAAESVSVPVALHLDHCPDRAFVTVAVENGWSSVLFDASDRPLEQAWQETKEVVAEAHAKGVGVECEIENIVGVEDGVGSDEPGHAYSNEQLVEVVTTTGADMLAPQLGTAHGLYKASPVLLYDRVAELRQALPGPGRAARRHRPDRRRLPPVHRQRRREGQPVDHAQARLHAGGPGAHRGGRGQGQVGAGEDVRRHHRRGEGDGHRPHAAARQRGRGEDGGVGMSGDVKSRALILDCDGVLADTERDGHLVAFNQTFEELGFPFRWSEDEYAVLLKIGGGKERMRGYLAAHPEIDLGSGDELDEKIVAAHKRKSEIYIQLVDEGRLPGRPGVKRLVEEALDAGWQVAVASTSAARSVEAVLRAVVGEQTRARMAGVWAGDIVPAKKPAPDIYLLTLKELGREPDEAVVVEDSESGARPRRTPGCGTSSRSAPSPAATRSRPPPWW